MTTHLDSLQIETRARRIYLDLYGALAKRTDRLFAFLFAFQWALGIVFALWISPKTWTGGQSQTHLHVYAAFLLGALISLPPIVLAVRNPGATLNRMVIAVSQVLFSVLLIHLTGGRIETHFHVFGSLAFLAIYRDWRVVLLGTVVTATDHLVRGAIWPESVYGVLSATPWRAIEHAAWVVFEDFVLLYSIRIGLEELRAVSHGQASLEATIASIEDKVRERTKALEESQRTVTEQQHALMASSKMSALGEMAGGVAHEINNPLAIIKVLSSELEDLAREEPLNRPFMLEISQKISKTTDRLAKIVQGLRSFSRDGSRDPYAKVNVKDLVEETLSFCRERFANHGTEIRVHAGLTEHAFEGRATQISQVLMNLLNNAQDAITPLEEKWIEISASENDRWLEIRVTDSGRGIAPEVRAKIFQPFFTTKEIGKGTGMGLSISLGIVQSHGGELSLDTNSPHTCFAIRLPKQQQRTPYAT